MCHLCSHNFRIKTSKFDPKDVFPTKKKTNAKFNFLGVAGQILTRVFEIGFGVPTAIFHRFWLQNVKISLQKSSKNHFFIAFFFLKVWPWSRIRRRRMAVRLSRRSTVRFEKKHRKCKKLQNPWNFHVFFLKTFFFGAISSIFSKNLHQKFRRICLLPNSSTFNSVTALDFKISTRVFRPRFQIFNLKFSEPDFQFWDDKMQKIVPKLCFFVKLSSKFQFFYFQLWGHGPKAADGFSVGEKFQILESATFQSHIFQNKVDKLNHQNRIEFFVLNFFSKNQCFPKFKFFLNLSHTRNSKIILNFVSGIGINFPRSRLSCGQSHSWLKNGEIVIFKNNHY